VDIEGVVQLTAAPGEEVLKLGEAVPGRTLSAEGRGFTLNVTKVSRKEDEVAIALTVSQTGLGLPADPIEHRRFGLFLVDPQGDRHHFLPTAEPRKLQAPGGERKSQYELRAWDLPRMEGAWSIAYVFPATPVTAEHAFVIKGVPVP
jgi:hypothetical protein